MKPSTCSGMMPPSTALVSFSTNSGTPSVRSTISVAIPVGKLLPRVKRRIISLLCSGKKRPRFSRITVVVVDPDQWEFWSDGDFY